MIKTSSKIIYIFLPFLFLLVAILFNVYSFASLGTVGGELYAITVKTDQLVAQNQKLTEQLALKGSLQDTLVKAEAQGFLPVSSLTRVELQDTKVALGSTTISP